MRAGGATALSSCSPCTHTRSALPLSSLAAGQEMMVPEQRALSTSLALSRCRSGRGRLPAGVSTGFLCSSPRPGSFSQTPVP